MKFGEVSAQEGLVVARVKAWMQITDNCFSRSLSLSRFWWDRVVLVGQRFGISIMTQTLAALIHPSKDRLASARTQRLTYLL